MSLSVCARKVVACCWLAMASTALVFGQPVVPLDVEYAIPASLRGDQTMPQAAISADGGYLVWQDNAIRRTGMRIMAARLDAGLRGAGKPFPVSSAFRSAVAGIQCKPQVTLLKDGGAAVVWQAGAPRLQRIWARFIRANGTFIRGDILVSKERKRSLSDPQVACLADGNVVLVWTSEDQDGSMKGVFARLFSPEGKPLSTEFQVNATTLYNQRNPALAALPEGGFVAVWVSELQRRWSGVDVYARVFDNSGLPVTSEININASSNVCANPSVAASPNGGFAVAWSQNDSVPLPALIPFDNVRGSAVTHAPGSTLNVTRSTNSWDVYGATFDSTGGRQGGPVRLNARTYGDQFGPKIAGLFGGYLAVWSSLDQDNDPREGVFAQVLTADGVLGGTSDLHVNTTMPSRQLHPAVASDGAGRFLVVWSCFVGGDASFDLLAQPYELLVQ